MADQEQDLLFIDLPVSGRIPVRLIREVRSSIRASVGKKYLIFRRPRQTYPGQESKHWKWFMDWARQIDAQNNGRQLAHLRQKNYGSGYTIQTTRHTYRLELRTEDRKTAAGRIAPDKTLRLTIPESLSDHQRNAAIKTLLSRCIGEDQLPWVSQRVHFLNDRHFQQKIGRIRLKYNHSNWGSCSRTGNINLSTRLLFAPEHVVDYVIIHELAHRVEFNHSPKFWRLVEQAMTDFAEAELWLKRYYDQCDF